MSHVEEVREAVRAVNVPPGSQSLDDSRLRPLLQQLARYWWVELLLGVFWVVVAIVVFTSVVTVGVLTGIMFLVFAPPRSSSWPSWIRAPAGGYGRSSGCC